MGPCYVPFSHLLHKGWCHSCQKKINICKNLPLFFWCQSPFALSPIRHPNGYRLTSDCSRFLVNKTNRWNELQFYWYYDSTCFGQPFCHHQEFLADVRLRTPDDGQKCCPKNVESYYYYYYYYCWYSALGPFWAETRVQSGDWYGSGTLHSGQVLRGSLPLLSAVFRCSHFSPPGASTSAATWEIPAAEVGTVGENVVR